MDDDNKYIPIKGIKDFIIGLLNPESLDMSVRKKLRDDIRYALKEGLIKTELHNGIECAKEQDVINWISSKKKISWMSNIPCEHLTRTGHADVTAPIFGVEGGGFKEPLNMQEGIQIICQLRQALRDRDAEIADLKPDAEAHRKRKADGRIHGTKAWSKKRGI